jgi:hypothetical protein
MMMMKVKKKRVGCSKLRIAFLEPAHAVRILTYDRNLLHLHCQVVELRTVDFVMADERTP